MRPEYQQRVIDEYNELLQRTVNLGIFFDSPVFQKLPQDEQARLSRQWRHMQEYGLVLFERIEAFDGN